MQAQSPLTDVVCIGQAVIDCITRGREADAHRQNVYRAERIYLGTGGDAINESFNLAGMGYHVRLVCGLGEDLAGSILLREAEKRGIDLSHVRIVEGMATPVANLIVSKDGSRYSINSAATMLEGYLPAEEDVTGAKIVSFASLFRAPLDQKEVILRLIRAAHDSGAIVCCDTKLPTFRQVMPEELKEIWPLVDYIFPNEREAAFYTGETEYLEMARAIRGWGVKNVIVKTGPDGCCACLQEGEFVLPALPVVPVDTTGCGDSFVSGFLSGLLQKKSGRECLDNALQCAANCAQHMGGTL
ncbi:MAG: carbohydrate kinase family protein [Lachnospiraceae bacterium]|nr:carbohydrate kinase family protein [Lachnospiraceae bacterium]